MTRPMCEPLVAELRGAARWRGHMWMQQARTVDYRQLSTTVKMTARVRADGAVAVDLSVKDIGAKPPGEDGHPGDLRPAPLGECDVARVDRLSRCG